MARLVALFGDWRPRLQMVGQNVPTVDVLIPCCNEDPDIIIDTTRAVLQMDYPRNRYRVLITDDGNSRELASYVEQLSTEYPNLHYTARKKTGPDGFKAGNLNHALSFLSALPEGAAEFVASLDADMIPDKRWLRALVPHLVRDPQLAVVCPPQHFYNAPLNDALCQANRYFSRSFEVLKDMAGAAWNTGSGWITRREALDLIGGWPTDSITEDAYCSTMLLAAGWKAAYVQEELQHGLVPDSYYKHIKQRTRWNVGGAQRTANMGFFLRKAWARKFTAGHRFFHMLYSIDYFSPILLCLGIIVTPICLFMGSKLAPYQDLSQLRLMLQLKCLVLLAGWLNDLHNSLFTGYQVGLSEQASRVWMSPYHMITLVRSFILPSCLGGQLSGFTATGSVPDTLHERRPDQRAPLSKRLQHILTDCGAIFHLGFIILCSLGITNMVYQCFGAHSAGSSHSWMLFLSNLALPLPFWYQLIIGCFVPLQYAIFPPDVPEREACLFRDPITGVAYPTQKAKKPQFTLKTVDYAHFHFPIVLYALGLFASTWWI
ncbi:glycosyltransferase family 2 protein [Aplosporella prunicola CBS 121167]|uniref:Glycosyltransferase family 2 protein n=1 Tax=Aplosporella prunicola CBS 121167 TaxID=1176127 RepID=A0A6A6BQ67_9PEZI|nr:glycosyltransferase family 2 protein [Aplosporella prunicola CBS 121167]KAF2146272.1 glycosyltransferase family 2 protein [Aplosporella prunicola CBS 121167]